MSFTFDHFCWWLNICLLIFRRKSNPVQKLLSLHSMDSSSSMTNISALSYNQYDRSVQRVYESVIERDLGYVSQWVRCRYIQVSEMQGIYNQWEWDAGHIWVIEWGASYTSQSLKCRVYELVRCRVYARQWMTCRIHQSFSEMQGNNQLLCEMQGIWICEWVRCRVSELDFRVLLNQWMTYRILDWLLIEIVII